MTAGPARIEAVKVVRERTGLGFAVSVRAVDPQAGSGPGGTGPDR